MVDKGDICKKERKKKDLPIDICYNSMLHDILVIFSNYSCTKKVGKSLNLRKEENSLSKK